jgi:hypothetical protein
MAVKFFWQVFIFLEKISMKRQGMYVRVTIVAVEKQ